MQDELFPRVARRNCSTYQLRRDLQRRAVAIDGSRENAASSNLLFVPSKIQECLDFESVKKTVNCSCAVCGPVIVREPFSDTQLINEIIGEPETRLLLAILIYMGAGFTMRSLYFHGLGRDNNLNVEEAFASNAGVKSKLFGHLPALFTSSWSVDEISNNFCAIFAETKHLFSPPVFREGTNFRGISRNANLPFITEKELRSRESSYARLYKFKIHPEFCSSALSVRSNFDPSIPS